MEGDLGHQTSQVIYMSSSVPVNFHCHSIFSDGDQTPEALAANLAKAGVRFAALTDHDTLEGLRRFSEAAGKHGVVCLPGVEITTWYNGTEVHLLAYDFNPENVELLAMLYSLRQIANLEVHSIADSIRKKGTNFSNHSEESHKIPDGVNGRLNTIEAIALVHRAGGKVFLAHPLVTEPSIELLDEMVQDFKNHGLDGIEAIYDVFSEQQRSDLCEMADRHNLLVSAGTDLHSNNGVFAINLPRTRWVKLREAIFTSPSFSNDPMRKAKLTNQGGSHTYRPSLKPHIFRRRASVIRIFLPSLFAIGLFLAVIWGILLPSFEQTLLDRKRELIRELTYSAWSILASYQKDEQNGILTREEAQSMALKQIEALRYGPEGKDYFWIQDLQPKMLMHPYRPDLNGQDVSNFTDTRGVPIFVEFANLVSRDGEGYIDYVWQWKDDPNRLEPKESYVKGFTPWGWIIGTGIYTDDVRAEIVRIERSIVNTSLVVTGVVVLLLLFVLQQSMKIDRERQEVVDSLRESTERYHSLVEATTEGTLLVVNDRCRYANPTFLNMSGYSARQLEFLELEDLVRREDENTDFWQRFDFLTNQEPPHGTELQATGGLDGVLRCADGEKLDCVFILNPIVFAGQSGLILLAKDVAHGSAVLAQDIQPLTAQAAPVGIFRARLNRRASIQEMNTTAQEFFADPNPSLADIFMDFSEFDEIISSLQDGNQVSNHLLQTSSPDASMHFISLSAKVVNDSNEQGAFIAGTLQDVTEQHRGELERGKLVEKLQASLLFLHEPLSRLGRNVLISDFQMSVSELARLMTARNTTAAIITSEKNMLGIVTDQDLRTRVLASGASASMPIHTIMSAPLVKISEDALIYEALLLMEEKNIRHLAIEDHEGQIVNVVDNKSLIQFQSYGTVVLIREISHATNPQDISLLAKRTPLLAQTLIDSSARPRHVTRMLASICDSATERLVQLAIDELGPPPTPYAFISMGSQGRQEQTLLTDQDNGIIYMPSSEAEAGAANDYFLQMGKRVCEGLEQSGYPYCRGGVMANNPRWCRSLPDWISSFREGIQTPEPQEIIDLSIFLDFRTVCGDNEITRELLRAIDLALAEEPGIFHHLAEGALNFKPPFRLLGNVYLGGSETEHSGEINLKDAMMPIVTFARLYSLRYQVGRTHTVERIESLSEKGEILPSSREEIISSYDFLMQLRLQSQLTMIKRGLPLTNVVRVNQLGYMQQEQLKQSFAQISAVQKKIEYDFLSGG